MPVSFSKRLLWLMPALLFAPALFAQAVPLNSSSSLSSSSSDRVLLPKVPSAELAARASLPAAKSSYEYGGYSGELGVHVACGAGLDFQQGRSQGTLVMCGAGFTLIPYSALELGGLRLQDGSAHFYLSEDAIAPLTPMFKHLRGDPIGILGYTKIVGNSNRLDYGFGWEHHVGPQQSIGFEVRDYLQFTSPVQHAVVFRLSLVGGTGGVD